MAHILYAEDMEVLRFAITRALKKFGHTYDEFVDGTPALEGYLAQPDSYQLILTDHNMGPMNGTTLIEKIRDAGYSTPAIFFTGNPMNATPQFENVYRLDKPCPMDELRSTIDTALGL